MALEWRAETSRGLVRPNNEDSWSVMSLPVGRNNLWLAMVADGIGGYDGGEIASSLAVDSIQQYLEKRFLRKNPAQMLKEAIVYSNNRIRENAVGSERLSLMGTTLTCVMVNCDQSKAFVGHVGDSRAYIVSNGKIRRITNDHSVSGTLIKNGTISEDDAMKHPGSNILTMALGTHEFINVDVYEENLKPNDIIVLCTDGLTSLVTSYEIHQMLLIHGKDEVADKLVDLAIARGGYDNITVIIIWF